MSTTICEQIVSALIDDLNTGRPGGVPLIERDRWVDVESDTLPVVTLSGWEDDPVEHQDDNVPLDERLLALHFEIYSYGTPQTTTGSLPDGLTTVPAVPPSRAVDAMWEWITRRCGVPDSSSPWADLGVASIRCGKRLAVVGKGNFVRSLCVLIVKYQNVVNDATRAG